MPNQGEKIQTTNTPPASGYESLIAEVPFAGGNKKSEGRPEASKRLSGREFMAEGDEEAIGKIADSLHKADFLIPKSKKEDWDAYVKDQSEGYTYDKGEHIIRMPQKIAENIPKLFLLLNNKKRSPNTICDAIREYEHSEYPPAAMLEAALRFSARGPELNFLYNADLYMPLDRSKEPQQLTSNIGFTNNIASQTKKNNPSSSNTFEDYKKSVAETQKLWEESEGIISEDDRKAWRQTLCVNALSESAGTDTKHALGIMKALNLKKQIPNMEKQISDFLSEFTDDERKIIQNSSMAKITQDKYPTNYTKLKNAIAQYRKLEDSKQTLMKNSEITPDKFLVNDARVRALVLRYSDQGVEFYQNIVGNPPKVSEAQLLVSEILRRQRGLSTYSEIPKEDINNIIIKSFSKTKQNNQTAS